MISEIKHLTYCDFHAATQMCRIKWWLKCFLGILTDQFHVRQTTIGIFFSGLYQNMKWPLSVTFCADLKKVAGFPFGPWLSDHRIGSLNHLCLQYG